MTVLTLTLVGVVAVVIITVGAMRLVMRWTATNQFFSDGAVLSEDGLEFLRFFRRKKVAFGDIESVALLPFDRALLSRLFLHGGRPVHEMVTRFGSDYVFVKLKPREARWYEYYFEYLLFTPANPVQFVEQLNYRLKTNGTADPTNR